MPTNRNRSAANQTIPRAEQVLALARAHGLLRPRDLKTHRIPREYLSRLHERGELERLGRGLYRLPNAEIAEHYTLAQVAKRLPGAVICLLSALRFHNLTTQAPAKTVADCFKYRSKLGLDVALEALREGWRERRFTMDELWQMARVCRVANVMRPYLEAIV